MLKTEKRNDMKKSKRSKQKTLVPIANPKTETSSKRLPKRSTPGWFGEKGWSKYHH